MTISSIFSLSCVFSFSETPCSWCTQVERLKYLEFIMYAASLIPAILGYRLNGGGFRSFDGLFWWSRRGYVFINGRLTYMVELIRIGTKV